MFRFPTFILLFTLCFLLACSIPSWFPIQKGPPHKAKKKELLHQEVVIIDQEEYVRVLNPRASKDRDQPKYLYIPVDEYLTNREAFAASAVRKEETEKEFAVSNQPVLSIAEKETFQVASSAAPRADLKKRVLMAYFDDRNQDADEVFGDWMAEKLAREVTRRSGQILFADYQMVKEFLEEREHPLANLESPETLHLLNEVLGIHALVVGQLSGPYVFTRKAVQEENSTSSAIIQIEVKIVDTLSGKTLKNLSASNAILASKEKGIFSEEKAKIKAIDLAIRDISRELSRELERLDWFCRVAKVEGEEIYINAGKLTGLRVGDVMVVSQPGGEGKQREAKSRIQISAFLGIDASMGRLIDGKKPDVNDILKPAEGKGT
jgi:hypothetical protein